MTESEIGLYSDSRFPGRCIVTMLDHFDHISEVPPLKLMTFMEEIQFSVDAIRRATGCERVNVAILGNAESHVHAHLVPRRPDVEPKPNKAPWEDPRKKETLSARHERDLIEAIHGNLSRSLALSTRPPVALKRRRKVQATEISPPATTLFDLMPDGDSVR